MTEPDLHPEQLLARVRAGTATSEERQRVAEHLQHCAVCRAEQALMDQVRGDVAAMGSLDEAAARVRQRVLEGTAPATRRPMALPGRRVRAAAVTFAMVLASGAAAALVAVTVHHKLNGPSVDTVEPIVTTSPPVQAAPPSGKVEAPVASVEPADAAAPTQEPSPPTEETRRPQPVPAVQRTAAERYSLANSARRKGQIQQAIRHYRGLQREFPGSPEAHASRVSLGRLLLDRAGNPGGALQQFRSYRKRGGALAHEALVGEARSLARLGRRAEERAAWQKLLRSFPQSTYSAHARERIDKLATP